MRDMAHAGYRDERNVRPVIDRSAAERRPVTEPLDRVSGGIAADAAEAFATSPPAAVPKLRGSPRLDPKAGGRTQRSLLCPATICRQQGVAEGAAIRN
jgi:hypothetical protein